MSVACKFQRKAYKRVGSGAYIYCVSRPFSVPVDDKWDGIVLGIAPVPLVKTLVELQNHFSRDRAVKCGVKYDLFAAFFIEEYRRTLEFRVLDKIEVETSSRGKASVMFL